MLRAQLCLTLCDPMDCSPPGSSVHGNFFFRQEYSSKLPLSPSGDLPDPGIEPASPVSPALAGGFFTTVPSGKPQGNDSKYEICSESSSLSSVFS